MCARATGKLRILNFLSLFFNNLLGVCSFGTHLLTLVSFDHLDNELARGLIDSTVVSEYRNSQGNTIQDIKISYRLINILTLS